jgi:hypothetical protein
MDAAEVQEPVVQEVAQEPEEQEYAEVKKKPRAKRAAKAKPPPVEIPPPMVGAEFWHDMMRTKREMDRDETRARYANLVTFK